MTWLIVVTSMAAYLGIARSVAGHCARRYAGWHERSFPNLTKDSPDWYRHEAQVIGGLGGLFWPVLLLGYAVVVGLFGLAGQGPRFPSEIKQEHERLQQRITELERELGIKP